MRSGRIVQSAQKSTTTITGIVRAALAIEDIGYIFATLKTTNNKAIVEGGIRVSITTVIKQAV